jgi:hypothetical protein
VREKEYRFTLLWWQLAEVDRLWLSLPFALRRSGIIGALSGFRALLGFDDPFLLHIFILGLGRLVIILLLARGGFPALGALLRLCFSVLGDKHNRSSHGTHPAPRLKKAQSQIHRK